MTEIQKLKDLLSKLYSKDANTVQILHDISIVMNNRQLYSIFLPEVLQLLKENHIFTVLAKVLETNFQKWKFIFPDWIRVLFNDMFQYRAELDAFPIEQARVLVAAFRKFVMSNAFECMKAFCVLAAFFAAQQILVNDDELLNILKKELDRSNTFVLFFNSLATGFEPGQLKILEDNNFILALLQHAESGNSDTWRLFYNISQHPDAKTLLPTKEIISKASKTTKSDDAVDTCTLLCSENDLKELKLSAEWVETQAALLNSLLKKGNARRENNNYSLLSLLLPIANMSIVDEYKRELGQKATVLLLQVVLAENLLDIATIQRQLTRSRQEASRALWNLAYFEDNCTLIKEANGIDKLKNEWESTKDNILKKNIAGILHMCKELVETPLPVENTHQKTAKHVMISYNWGNQPTVLKIAQELKDHGYNVWLDLEQMGGSTLEAMALAIEHSDIVLICMSQKYKDSPNCRLEGEYCINRRVEFVPLMMQAGYQPDGWLGITLGAKLWYDFSNDNNWDSKIAELVKAIGDRGKSHGSIPHLKSSKSLLSLAEKPEKKGKQISDWTEEDIHIWLKENQMENIFEIFKKHEINGKAIAELKRILNLHKFSFFQKMCCKMGITEMGKILCLSSAINKL